MTALPLGSGRHRGPSHGLAETVAVIIPAKNEAELLETTIDGVLTLPGVDLVVVVDDGSIDATSAVAKDAGAVTVRHRRNKGKAAAMATGAKVVALREVVAQADGPEEHRATIDALAAGHTGPLPVVGLDPMPSRALLFVDADLGESAAECEPLVSAVLADRTDMAIALLPTQHSEGGGIGLVVKAARTGIRRATGYEPEQPLSGTRCLTRDVWEACQPLARGWGVETSLTIDALRAGFRVDEIPCELYHRVTGADVSSQLHRAGQLRDVVRALVPRIKTKS